MDIDVEELPRLLMEIKYKVRTISRQGNGAIGGGVEYLKYM